MIKARQERGLRNRLIRWLNKAARTVLNFTLYYVVGYALFVAIIMGVVEVFNGAFKAGIDAKASLAMALVHYVGTAIMWAVGLMVVFIGWAIAEYTAWPLMKKCVDLINEKWRV